VFVFSLNSLHAQVSPLYAKHYVYEQFINPAITGRDLSPVLNISHKQYWLGTKDAPNSTGVGASSRLGSFDFYNPRKMLNRTSYTSRGRMGVGGLFIQENDGPMSSYVGMLNYAYFIPINDRNTELSLGVSAQFMYFSVNRSMLNPQDATDPELNKLGNSSIVPESGFGIYYHNPQFYAGASINDILKSDMPFDKCSVPSMRDYFFQTGYKFFLYRFDLEPSLYLAKVNERPLYYFSQVKIYYQNVNWIAIAYK
jgi:type IX secretion system PorP/SprF family membrane protein